MPKITPNSQQIKNQDNKIIKPNVLTRTENEHKEWYDEHQLGKQRGKPTAVPQKQPKEKGTRRHSLRSVHRRQTS